MIITVKGEKTIYRIPGRYWRRATVYPTTIYPKAGQPKQCWGVITDSQYTGLFFRYVDTEEEAHSIAKARMSW